LWQQLQDWYVEASILEIEDSDEKKKPKLVWNELSNKYDAPVKAVNQLYSRLCEIFPKVQIHRYNGRDEIGRKGQKYLLGINFVQNSARTAKTGLPELPVDTASITELPGELPKYSGNPVGNSQTLTQSAGNSGNSISSPFTEFLQWFSKQPQSERENMVKMLTQLQHQPEQSATPPQPKTVEAKKGLRVRYIGTKYAEQLAGLELVVNEVNKYKEITCIKPDGRFTTWLKPEELEYIVD
jgi:putative DNA primase/helicase